MSLYQMQKFLFEINRSPELQASFRQDRSVVISRYKVTPDERHALLDGDIGLIYVLGANGQLLMHFAAFLGIPWAEYLQAMRDGIVKHGPVRAGVYAMTTEVGEKVAGV